jgi:hypothetical protein
MNPTYEQLLSMVQNVASTPLEGEPCPDDPPYTQHWEVDGHIQDRFAAMITQARTLLGNA